MKETRSFSTTGKWCYLISLYGCCAGTGWGACASINPTGKGGKAALILFWHPWPAEILSELHWSQLSCREGLTCKAGKANSGLSPAVQPVHGHKLGTPLCKDLNIHRRSIFGRKCWDLTTKNIELQTHMDWKRSWRSSSPRDSRIWVLIFMLLGQWKYKLLEKPWVDNLLNSFSG